MRRVFVTVLTVGLAAGAGASLQAEDYAPSRKREQREWEQLTEQFAKEYRAGRLDNAARRAEDSLKHAERSFGPDHPNVAVSLSNLAMVAEAAGDYGRVEALLTRALAIRERSLGPTHPDVGKSLTNLGRLKHFQRRYAEAEPLYQRALAVQEAQGKQANEVASANALHDLGVLYRDQHEYEKAGRCLQRELDIWEHRFGPDEPLVLPLLDLYAEVLRRAGDSRKAEALDARAARIRNKRDATVKQPK